MTVTAGDDDLTAPIDECLERMLAVARRMIARHPDLRRCEHPCDLVHDAYLRLRAAMRAPTLQSPRCLVALAVAQLNREFVDRIRRGKSRGAWERRSREMSDVSEAPDDSLEDWSRFHEAVGSLPDGQRQAVELLWYHDLDQREAAARLGVSLRTLRRHWHDGRATLRRRLPDLAPRQ